MDPLQPAARTVLLTSVTMVAFASNSLLCRLALQHGSIDAASFSSIRLVSGAVMLLILARANAARTLPAKGDWLAAVMLFGYVAFFSFAYVTVSASTGALILFGAVQLTMFAAGLHAGEQFATPAWLGLVLALAGLIYLVSPGITAPTSVGAALMSVAGVCWGVYSLRGRGVANPLAATAANFLRAAPLALVLSLFLLGRSHATPAGIALAITSGAVTSGIGYVIWYAALKGLSAMRAATVQLSVPPIAAFGAVLLLSEAITMRLVLASAAILGGIAMAMTSRTQSQRPAPLLDERQKQPRRNG
ncbi:DMT family transporter [Paraburkholderia sp. Ac-20340]|uniref:DMT family transporter n=1 Tax=Paraburkholderia sp. Ac-20340 TaxID=2703888 RepID=UPI00197F05EC|nr:DMT family transporter [Paraburkholderia sp. Ac-20340]MBN3852279.1 DMT family transporter [Paraburkholderia sp. Ac-20340]